MKVLISNIVLGLGLSTGLATVAQAASVKLTFNYMATNLKGDFATASGNTATTVAELYLTDHADIGIANPNGGSGGVRANFKVLSNGLSQFSSGVGNVYISAFELNFPGTSVCVDATCANADDSNGYDSDDNGGLGNNWSNVTGVPLAGGVEWAENGANNGWGAAAGDPSFGQELNWGNSGILNQASGYSAIDIFSADQRDDISVANILANPVHNTDPTLPDAYAWIKVRSNASADPTARGIATDQWWGTPQTSGNGANQRWQLNVLAMGAQEVSLDQVPLSEPGGLWMMAPVLGGLWVMRRRNRVPAA